jgi:hypothetical protein
MGKIFCGKFRPLSGNVRETYILCTVDGARHSFRENGTLCYGNISNLSIGGPIKFEILNTLNSKQRNILFDYHIVSLGLTLMARSKTTEDHFLIAIEEYKL